MDKEVDSEACQWRLDTEPDHHTNKSSKISKMSMKSANSTGIDRDIAIKMDIPSAYHITDDRLFSRLYLNENSYISIVIFNTSHIKCFL